MPNASLFDDSLDDEFHGKALDVASQPSPCLDDSLCLDGGQEFQSPLTEVEKNAGEPDSASPGTHRGPSRAKHLTVSVKKVAVPPKHSPPTTGQCVPSVNPEDSMETAEQSQEAGSVPQVSTPALHAAGTRSSPATDMATYVMEELFPTTIDDGRAHKLSEDDQEGSSPETAQPLESDTSVKMDSGGVGEAAPNTTSPLDKKMEKPGAKRVVPSFGKKSNKWVPPTAKGSPPTKPPTAKAVKGNSSPDPVAVRGEENVESCGTGTSTPEPLSSPSPSTENSKPNLAPKAAPKKKSKSKAAAAAADTPTEAKVSNGAAKPPGETKKANQESKKLVREAKAQQRRLKQVEKEQKKAEKEKEREKKRLEMERKKAEREQKKIERELKKLKKGQKFGRQAENKEETCRSPQVMEAAIASSPTTREPALPQESAKSEPPEQPTSPHAAAVKLSTIEQSELEVLPECLKIDIFPSTENSASSQKSQKASEDMSSQSKDCEHEAKMATTITGNVTEDSTSSGVVGSTGKALNEQASDQSGVSVSKNKTQAKKSIFKSPAAIVTFMAAAKQKQPSSKDHGQLSRGAKGKQGRKQEAAKASRPPKRARKESSHRGSSEPRRKRSQPANYSGPVWAQCIACGKWRRLDDCQDPCSLPEMWDCSMNTGTRQSMHACCLQFCVNTT